MPQVINTNLAALNAQRNLDGSSRRLNISLQRLSSGLRINSAKDDAAGLAIATRFSSRIQGLSQASRNANDAISLAQVAEGALQETTSILQRGRELAIQAANGSNSAADRKALQAEVNQLKQEMTRVSTTTTFNGLNILNGELTNTTFQIGSEANQTVSVSISDTRTTAIGTNEVKTSNTAGIEQATHLLFVGGGTNTDAAGVGTDIGVAALADASADINNYAATLFTVTNTTATGATNTATQATAANDTADEIATTLSTVTGVTATAFNQVVVSNLAFSDTNDTVTLVASGSTTGITMNLITGETSDFSSMATALNGNTDFSNAGIYAVSTASNLTIYATNGEDFIFGGASTAGGTVDLSVNSGFREAAASTAITFDSDSSSGANSCHARGGRVDIQLDAGYSISANNVGLMGGTTGVALTTTASGLADITANNSVVAQTLTISGSTGSGTVSIADDNEASAIATAINAVSGTTNVSASAQTQVNLRGLSADGTVGFDLFGDNISTAPASISAAITTADFTALIKAINDASGNTGVTAATDGANNIITLTHATGKDIKIKNFTHTAGQDFQSPTSDAPVTGDGSSVVSAVTATLSVLGNVAGNQDANGNYIGTTVTLYAGSTQTNFDSTVIGGQISFSSSASFSVSSSITGEGFSGSLFNTAANAGNTSTAATVNTVDISTAAGAQSAISIFDEAINQISEIRADLGAVQSRFESAIRNLANNIENLNVARSRILDTDFAAETAELTKNQILTQAGVSILAQANALPQNVLALLQ